jgi:hypothetical protein
LIGAGSGQRGEDQRDDEKIDRPGELDGEGGAERHDGFPGRAKSTCR